MNPKPTFGYTCCGSLTIGGRKYDLRRISISSGKRLRALLNSDRVEKRVEFDDSQLTPTVYFWYGGKP
jgi:hypothetical protein